MEPIWPLLAAFASAGFPGETLDRITSLIVQYGYPAVFAAALLEVVFPPIPSEVIFPLVGFVAKNRDLGIENALGMATVGAMGSTVGAVVIYYLSRYLGRPAILRYGRFVKIGEQQLQKAERWFYKYGPLAVFSARMVPGVRELISIPAGMGGMHLPKFVAYTFAGSFVWAVALTLLGFYLGEAWVNLSESLSVASTTIGTAILVAAILGVIVWYFRRPKNS